jgi:hypothetical protein
MHVLPRMLISSLRVKGELSHPSCMDVQYKLNAAVEEDAVRKSDEARATLLSDLEKESKIVKPEAPKSVKAKDAKKKDKRKSKDARVRATRPLVQMLVCLHGWVFHLWNGAKMLELWPDCKKAVVLMHSLQ